MASHTMELVAFVMALTSIVALVGFLYFLADRYTCLMDGHRLLRLLHGAAPQTYQYITGWGLTSWPSFHWIYNPQPLIEFLVSNELEEHDAIKRQKDRCRCWLEYYGSLPNYLWRIGKLALAIPIVLSLLLLFLFGSAVFLQLD